MSLINKVLSDLDQRGASGQPDSNMEAGSAFTDLPFAQLPQRQSNKIRYAFIAGVIVVLALSAGAGIYYFDKPGRDKVVSDSTAPEQLDNKRDTSKQVATQVSKKPNSVSKTKQVTAIKQTQPRLISKPVNKVARQSPAPVIKSKVEKIEIVDLESEVKSKFNKNTIPLRSEQRAEVAYQLAYDQLKARNMHKAERSLRRALALEPGHIKSRELLSGVYIKQGRWVEASELLRNGLSISPGHRTFSKLYARALMQLKQDKLAITVLQQHAPAIESDPEYFAILAALYQRQKDHASAAQTYQKIVQIQPLNGVWWVGLGISLEALGKSQQASQAYFKARKSGNLQNEIAHFTNNRLVVLDEIGYPAQ